MSALIISNVLVAAVSILAMSLYSGGFFSWIASTSFAVAMTVGFFASTTMLVFLAYVIIFSRDEPYRLGNVDLSERGTAARKRLFYSGPMTATTSATTAATMKATTTGRKIVLSDGDVMSNVGWLNLVLARVMTKFLFSKWGDIRKTILDRVNEGLDLPDILGDIDLRDFEIGQSAPIFHSIDAREMEDQSLEIDVHFEYEDVTTRFDLATEIVINYPYPGFARLPVEFGLENIYLHAKMRFVIPQDFSTVKFFFTSRPEYDMFFSNKFGYRHVLRNIPKLTDILNRGIDYIMTEKFVYPRFLEIGIDGMQANEVKKAKKAISSLKSKSGTSSKDKRFTSSTANMTGSGVVSPSPLASFRKRGSNQQHPNTGQEGFSEKIDVDDLDSSASQFRRRQQQLGRDDTEISL